MSQSPFSPARVRRHRAEAKATFLHARVAEDHVERLAAVNRRFRRGLVLGGFGAFEAALKTNDARAPDTLTSADVAGPADVIIDLERQPFDEGAFDLIVSNLLLHSVNDLPGALIQLRRALAPDGLFIATFFGGETLRELRASLIAAELDVRGGAGARIAPFADALDGAGLLQRAGFALPVSDVDRVIVRYRDPLTLFADLKMMGERNSLASQAPPLTRTILAGALAHYAAHFSEPDGRIRATFELVTLTGWAPHESQQQPLKPGSAKARLADALKTTEHSAGEKAGRT
jgi:SAM-dependent methyltransferase